MHPRAHTRARMAFLMPLDATLAEKKQKSTEISFRSLDSLINNRIEVLSWGLLGGQIKPLNADFNSHNTLIINLFRQSRPGQ
jgi:hypothetical protein